MTTVTTAKFDTVRAKFTANIQVKAFTWDILTLKWWMYPIYEPDGKDYNAALL